MVDLLKDKEAQAYYRESCGIDITRQGTIVRLSLENLYYRGVRLSQKKLYAKMTQCGIDLHNGVVDRTRMTAVMGKVAPEPPMLTHFGARMWYLTEPYMFDEEDWAFLTSRFPEETAERYPSLWKGYVLEKERERNSRYVVSELFDGDECVFQQDRQKQEGDRNPAFTV